MVVFRIVPHAFCAIVFALTFTSAVLAENPTPTVYTLETVGSSISLYPGGPFRSFIATEYQVGSFSKLSERIAQLPIGAHVIWPAEERQNSQKAGLFSEADLTNLRKVCEERHISLDIH